MENTNEVSSATKVRKVPVGKIVTYAVLILYTVFLFLPFLIVLFTAFKTDAEIVEMGKINGYSLFPKKWSMEGFGMALSTSVEYNAINGVPSLIIGFFNSLWQTLIPLVGGLLVSAFAAFMYSKYRFPGRKALFMVTVLTMMLPLGAFGFVSYLFYASIGWVGSKGVLAILIPGLFGGAGTVFFLRAYFDSAISNEILEAAKIDGANDFKIFLVMILPLAKPAIISQFLFGFVGGYNNYASALMYLYRDKSMWSLQLALSELVTIGSQSEGGYVNMQCAASIAALLPLLALYVGVQKYFIEGITIGGGKE